MVLSSAAASTQTTILPTAVRTTPLSMAVFKAIPSTFSKIHRRFLTPTVSTLVMGAVSVALYVGMNYLSNGDSVLEDSVSALGVWIAFYYGLLPPRMRVVLPPHAACESPFQCVPLRRHLARRRMADSLVRDGLGFCLLVHYYRLDQLLHHLDSDALLLDALADMGGVFVLDISAVIIGIILMVVYARLRPAYFRGEVLNRDTPTRVPQDIGTSRLGVRCSGLSRTTWTEPRGEGDAATGVSALRGR